MFYKPFTKINTTLEKAFPLKVRFLDKSPSIQKTAYKIKCEHYDFQLIACKIIEIIEVIRSENLPTKVILLLPPFTALNLILLRSNFSKKP